MPSRLKSAADRGSILILVLWMIILLGIVGLSYSSSVQSQLRVTQATQGKTQAYWAARAGIEHAKSILAELDLTTIAEGDQIFNDPELFADQPVGRARFSLIVPPARDGQEMRYGIQDEAARININQIELEDLLYLPTVTEEMAQSLIDWRDADSFPNPMGAESDYYEDLEDPYFARNGNFTSVRELLRVRGWAPVFDAAYPDPYLKFLPEEDRPVIADPGESRILLESLTAWSSDETIAPDGDEKISLENPNQSEMRNRAGLSNDDARAISDHDEFESPTDLLDVRASEQNNQNQNRLGTTSTTGSSTRVLRSGSGNTSTFQISSFQSNSGNQRGSGNQSGSGNQQSSGSGSSNDSEPIFDLNRVAEIIDYFTTDEGGNAFGVSAPKPGRVNINTASYEVLLALSGMSEALAEEIIQDRESNGPFETAGSIAYLSRMDEEMFRSIYPMITTTSSRFRVISRGIDDESRSVANIEAVLSVEEDGRVGIIYWREY